MKLANEKKVRLESILNKAVNLKYGLDFWGPRLETVPPAIQDLILSLFEQYPQEIEQFSAMQIQKEEAIAKNDQSAWKAIIEKEKEYLLNVIKE